jgi:hypothetical protein
MTYREGRRTAVCTIISKNYLHYARTLMASLRAVHPTWQPFVLLVDETEGKFDPEREPFTVVPVSELPLPQRRRFFFRYTQMELNTAVKPWFLEWLFREADFDRVVYLDPDIQVHAPLAEVEELLTRALLVLTPHLTGRLDEHRPNERDILLAGSYNLGFIALARHPDLTGFLNWWQEKLEFGCQNQLSSGLFVDQKWLDLAPGLFDGVRVLRHEGYNVAYWNLQHRRLERQGNSFQVNGRPLVFFHFSGVNPRAPEKLSRYQNRFRLDELGAVADLVRDYCVSLEKNGREECSRWPYAFGRYSNGSHISDLDRIYYRHSPALQRRAGADPFRCRPSVTWLWQPAMMLRAATIALWRGEALTRRLGRGLSAVAQKTIKHTLARVFAGRSHVREAERTLDRLPFHPPAAEPGLNIVGYVRSEHGVGESVRRSAQAAAAAELPFCLREFAVGNPHRSADQTWAHRLVEQPKHTVNLFHINADQMPVARAALGTEFFADRYNIGYWHWELPELPDAWLAGFEGLQEIWTPTRFVQDAISARSPAPVVRIPHAISFSPDRTATRASLGLPEREFLFLVLYDVFSISARKNPWGAIEAFRKAFPRPGEVKLVVKINNADRSPQEMQKLRAVQKEFPALVLLDRTLSRQEVYNLEALCDCLVSLHRSEGFGLCLAEAMFLGKPVVATDWSGNRDFMNAENSCPVRCEVVPLQRDYPPYRCGQLWAEPDLDHAAWYMARVVEEAAWARRLGEAARSSIRTSLSPVAVGRQYRQRLDAIARFTGFPALPTLAAWAS